MTEYLFDRDAALSDIDEIIGDNAGFKAWAIRAYIEQSPCIEIIRCRDCKYWVHIKDNAEYGICNGGYVINTSPADGYCYKAERRREE